MGVTEANSVTLIVFKSSHSPLIKLHLPIRLNFRNFKRLIHILTSQSNRTMNIKNLFSYAVISISALTVSAPLTGCAQKSEKQTSAADIQSSKERKGGKPGGGPVIDKSGDATLQAMIKSEVPQFKQFEYTDATTGKTMQYTLFTPKNIDESKKYPLVLFHGSTKSNSEAYKFSSVLRMANIPSAIFIFNISSSGETPASK